MYFIIFIAALSIIASFVAVVSGFGLSSMMIPLLSLFLPLPEVVLLVGIIHLANSCFKSTLFSHGLDWKLFIYFGVPSIIFSYIGASLIAEQINDYLVRLFGLFFIAYTALIFLVPDFKVKKTKRTMVAGGTTYGFAVGFFGIGGEIKCVFLSAFDMRKAVYIATTGILGVFVDATRVATYWYRGMQMDTVLWWGLLLILPATLLGAWVGRFFVGKIPQKKFRLVVGGFLFLIGVRFLFFPAL